MPLFGRCVVLMVQRGQQQFLSATPWITWQLHHAFDIIVASRLLLDLVPLCSVADIFTRQQRKHVAIAP